MKLQRLILPVILLIGLGSYYAYSRPPSSLVLTGIVTTNDVVVSSQIAGRVEDLRVKEGDTVERGQLVAVISPDELMAERTYASHNVQGLSSQVREAEATVRVQERQSAEQIRQAEATLASAQAQRAAADADLERSRLQLTRTESLAKEGIAPPQQLDEARTAYAAAQARVESLGRQTDAQRAAVDLARANAEQVAVRKIQVRSSELMRDAAAAQEAKAGVRLTYTEVQAPLPGVVDVRAVRPGEVVTVGQPLLTLVDPDDLWVRADVEESYIDRVKVSDHLQVRLPSGAELDGVVSYRGADAAFATQRDVSRTKRDIRTFEVRLRCDNKDRKLAVGMTAYVLLPLVSR